MPQEPTTVRFPNETDEYRAARAELLEAETDLRRRVEEIAAHHHGESEDGDQIPALNQEPSQDERATFTTMEASTAEDWKIISSHFVPYAGKLPDRVLAHLSLLEGDCGGFAVDRLTHSLQTATLAHRDGRDEEYVVCALLHDIGDTLGTYNHSDIAAAILRPFVSPENSWMVEKHGIFQGYYFFHHLGLDRNVRERFRDHPWFARTAEFCSRYDGPAFDPKGETLPLHYFEPMVRRVLAAPRESLYVARNDGAMAKP